jgi:aryl-alcohol dehydrogenase-like predicted oxidoreductase
MDYRMLGGSGCGVSSLCLETMTFGVETDESGAHQQLDLFTEAGGTMVDTAGVYGGGRSEEIIGRRFASRPIIDAVQEIAEERGVSMAEVALAWVTARPGVSSTIHGTRTIGQLETNLRAAGLHLTAAQTAALDAASDSHPADYPYGELGVEQRARTCQPATEHRR